jgi:hypothetical protein
MFPDGWSARQVQALDELAKPVSELTLAAVRPIKMLIEAPVAKAIAGSQRQYWPLINADER